MAGIAYAESAWPNGRDVAEFLGQGDSPEFVALAYQHCSIVKAMAYSYTRGNGFKGTEMPEDIGAVIITATARLLTNPGQLSEQVGQVSVRGSFNSWTLAETFVLNRYRKRAK